MRSRYAVSFTAAQAAWESPDDRTGPDGPYCEVCGHWMDPDGRGRDCRPSKNNPTTICFHCEDLETP